MNRNNTFYWIHRLRRFLKHSTPKRVRNLILIKLHFHLATSEPRELPPIIHIDPLNYCNLHCAACPTGRGVLAREKGRMPLDLFKTLVDEVADRIYFLNLYNWGEPLLHPQIFEMVEYATSRGLSVRISSNLNALKPGQARRMVESGLEELLVDLDGADQATYEQYRIGGRLDWVTRSIKEIVSLRSQLRTPYPLITARALVTRPNESKIPQVAALARDLGVDRFQTLPIYVDIDDPAEVAKWVPTTRVAAQSGQEVSSLPPRKCDQLWLNLTVSWDGGVFPCCWFHQQEYDFGRVSEGIHLGDIWNNEIFVASRCFVAGKTDAPPASICARCKGYPESQYSY